MFTERVFSIESTRHFPRLFIQKTSLAKWRMIQTKMIQKSKRFLSWGCHFFCDGKWEQIY